VARATSPLNWLTYSRLSQTYAAQQAELRKGERAAQQAALQSAAGRVGADREQQAKQQLKAAEASRRQGEHIKSLFMT
jgi:hypothetical protein